MTVGAARLAERIEVALSWTHRLDGRSDRRRLAKDWSIANSIIDINP